jgi:hypothetical protein
MSCCPEADFTFLAGGVQVRDRTPQFDSVVVQFFPYRAIQSVRYAYSRDDREGTVSIWMAGQGTPGVGGLSYRWRFPCSDAGQAVYQQLIEKLG